MPADQILIAGGGIGGLAAALALARAGRQVTVLERSRRFGEIGAGIQLGPNAFHMFDALGIGSAARRMAVEIDSLRLMDALSAGEIARIPLGDRFRTRFGNPYAVIHRGALHGVILKACQADPAITLVTSAEVTGYGIDAGKVTATLADGNRMTGAGLIGADGLWSAIRRQMLGDGAPLVSGHTTYRSVIATEDMPEDLRWNAATLWAGPRCHIVHYPLSDWKEFNLVVTCHNDAPEPVAGKPVTRDEVLEGFGHVHARARQIIEHGKDWKLWVLCDREPVSRWTEGPVALLGDAAHPMMQYMAQGACMALEDAVALGRAVADEPDLGRALARYAGARYLRTARVQLQSREVGRHVYHPEGAHADLRNQIMGARSETEWHDTVAWLYGYDGTDQAPRACVRR